MSLVEEDDLLDFLQDKMTGNGMNQHTLLKKVDRMRSSPVIKLVPVYALMTQRQIGLGKPYIRHEAKSKQSGISTTHDTAAKDLKAIFC